MATTLDDELVVPGNDGEAKTLNEMAVFIWKQTEVPRTKAEILSAIVKEYDVSRATASADLGLFLQQLMEYGLISEVGPSGPIPVEVEESPAALLHEAYKHQKGGDWQTAMALCAEATKDPKFGAIAELDILIARYHLARLDGLVEQAKALLPRLPELAQLACWGLALLAAHRGGDNATAKTLALGLARQVKEPWDLPTEPQFVVVVGTRVVVREEGSVDQMLAIVEDLEGSSDCSADEVALLADLARRYEQRRFKAE
jgi:hypothetical protein